MHACPVHNVMYCAEIPEHTKTTTIMWAQAATSKDKELGEKASYLAELCFERIPVLICGFRGLGEPGGNPPKYLKAEPARCWGYRKI